MDWSDRFTMGARYGRGDWTEERRCLRGSTTEYGLGLVRDFTSHRLQTKRVPESVDPDDLVSGYLTH